MKFQIQRFMGFKVGIFRISPIEVVNVAAVEVFNLSVAAVEVFNLYVAAVKVINAVAVALITH